MREGRPNPSRAARPTGAPPDVRTVSGASREHASVRESAGEVRGVGVERCGPGGLEGRDRRDGERSEPSRLRTATARRDHRERLGPRTATAGSRELQGAVSRSTRPGGALRSSLRCGACGLRAGSTCSRLPPVAVRNRDGSLRSPSRRSRPSNPPGTAPRPHHRPPQPTPSPSLALGFGRPSRTDCRPPLAGARGGRRAHATPSVQSPGGLKGRGAVAPEGSRSVGPIRANACERGYPAERPRARRGLSRL